jgi:hypothetical protein
VTGAVLLLVLVVQASTPVAAVRLDIQDAAGLPFSPSMLEAAVEARQPIARGADSASAGAVVVRPLGGGWVAIESPSRRQQLEVQGRAAPEAARLVALAVVDVLRPGVTASPAPAAANPSTTTPTGLAATAAPSVEPARGLSLSLLPGASFGFTSGAPSFEPTAEVTWWSGRGLAGGAWGLAAQVAFNRATSHVNLRRFVLDTLPVRLGARWGWRWFDAGGGAVLRSYRTAGIDGGQGATAGGFLSVRAGRPIGWGLRGLAMAACDFVPRSVDFRAAGLSVVQTRHAIPWLGLGLAWEGSR